MDVFDRMLIGVNNRVEPEEQAQQLKEDDIHTVQLTHMDFLMPVDGLQLRQGSINGLCPEKRKCSTGFYLCQELLY
ncbi:hypothetical protein D3C86_1417730 [compost metagenome]